MSNNAPHPVRERPDVDPRVRRSTHALGSALIELIQERDFDDITVQAILDRAGVGRTTFYAHYRNKEDVLHSSYDRVFSAFDAMVERPTPGTPRLFPVTEFLEHVAESRTLLHALRSAGRMEDAWALCAGYATRLIERRLASFAGIAPSTPRALLARMLAGALMEAVRWWEDHGASVTPAAMDAAFHELARGVVRRPG